MNENVIRILKSLYECVKLEEEGSAEHICEYFDSEEIRDALVEIGADVSDLDD